MQGRNQSNVSIEDINHYLAEVSLISHSTLKPTLQNHLLRLAARVKNNTPPFSIRSIHFPHMSLPSETLFLIRDILKLSNTKALSLSIHSLVKPFNSIDDYCSSFIYLIPFLGLNQLTINTNEGWMLADKLSAFFRAIRQSETISSLTLSNLIGNISTASDYEFNIFLDEIATLPIIILSLTKCNLNTWKDPEWEEFLRAIKLSSTIRQVNVSDSNLSQERLKQLDDVLKEKNSLMTLTAGSIAKSLANNLLLFKDINLSEVLPEPCLNKINQEVDLLSLRKGC